MTMKNKSRQGLLIFLITLGTLAPDAVFAGIISAQDPEMQQKVSDLKQAMAANKQEHFQVQLGPDGKPQKTSLDPPPDNSGHEGRLKKHIVEKKKEEYKEYADSIKTLVQQYVPPEKDLIEHARQQGNIMTGPAGAPGEFRLVISNYLKQGDNMTLVVDKAQLQLTS